MSKVTKPMGNLGHVWLSTDDSRHLAVFVSGEHGPVLAAARGEGTKDAALLELLEALEVVGVAMPRGDVTGHEWLAQRGMYVLVWTGQIYESVVEPSYGLSVDQLPEPLGVLARVNHLAGVNFAAVRQLGVAIPV
jgi:hypothetical protein